jgi:hypothetical protein
LLYTNTDGVSYTALKTYGGTASVIGVPGLVLEAWSLGVELNQTSDTGAFIDRVLDFSAGGGITPSYGPTIDFAGAAGSLQRVTGTALIDAFGAVMVKGSFAVELGTITERVPITVGGGGDTVYKAMALTLGTSAFTGAEAVEVFIGGRCAGRQPGRHADTTELQRRCDQRRFGRGFPCDAQQPESGDSEK